MRVAILDYDAGNVTSVQRSLANLGHDGVITADPAVVARCERIIFPGVGAAGTCMGVLKARKLDGLLRDADRAGTPILCVCVGLQLLFEHSDEDGGTECLGLLPGKVVRFTPDAAGRIGGHDGIKVPHMGWNQVAFRAGDPLARELPALWFYFVHSYYCVPADPAVVIATSDHGIPFCAGVRRGNLAAVQFHPEKSGPAGLKLLSNFLAA